LRPCAELDRNSQVPSGSRAIAKSFGERRAFPGNGEMITQVWRLKQLEYTWLRSLMHRYEDFSVITRDALAYTLRILGLKYDADVFERIMEKDVHLDLYPDARQTLAALKRYKLATLSNGSSEMLNTLVRNTGLDAILDATISIDARQIFKPSPEAYSLIEAHLAVTPAEVMFVSAAITVLHCTQRFGRDPQIGTFRDPDLSRHLSGRRRRCSLVSQRRLSRVCSDVCSRHSGKSHPHFQHGMRRLTGEAERRKTDKAGLFWKCR
jgi:2-haloalkanoic acid dehalogenase type II